MRYLRSSLVLALCVGTLAAMPPTSSPQAPDEARLAVAAAPPATTSITVLPAIAFGFDPAVLAVRQLSPSADTTARPFAAMAIRATPAPPGDRAAVRQRRARPPSHPSHRLTPPVASRTSLRMRGSPARWRT